MLKIRLKELRKKHRVTQEQLAEAIGVERSSIGKYEGNQNVIPSVEVLQAIADYFDVTTDFLLGRIRKYEKNSDYTHLLAEKQNEYKSLFLRDEFDDLSNDEIDILATVAEGLKAKRK